MSASDDKIVIERAIGSLRSISSDLDIEIDEEGPGESERLKAVQKIFSDALTRLEVELAKLPFTETKY